MLTGSFGLTKAVPPDYDQSARIVLRNAARYAIEERRDLVVFNYIEIFPMDPNNNEIWPSWVPQWHIKEEEEEMPRGLAEVFSADDGHPVDLERALGHPNLDLLILTGFAIGTASTVLPANRYEAFWNGSELLRIIREIQTCLGNRSTEPPELGETLISGTTHDSARASEPYYAKFSALLALVQETGQIPELKPSGQDHGSDESAEIEALWAYHQALYNALDNRCFFVTANASMGIGPRTLHPHDLIAVLYGSKWPVVLRPVESGQYRMIGTCYVHGIMDGEAVRNSKAVDRIEREFIVQ